MSICDNIKLLRETYNLSQKELGQIAGVSDKAVSTWENGTKEPRMGALQKIADHFGILKSNLIEDGGLASFFNVTKEKAPEITLEGKFNNIIEKLGKLTPDQLLKVEGFIQCMVLDNEAADKTAKQISDRLA